MRRGEIAVRYDLRGCPPARIHASPQGCFGASRKVMVEEAISAPGNPRSWPRWKALKNNPREGEVGQKLWVAVKSAEGRETADCAMGGR